MEMLREELGVMREKAEVVARKLENINGSKVRAGASTSKELLFDIYIDSKYDYFKIVVGYDEDKTIAEYLLEISDKAIKGDYTYYRVTELEKKLIDYIEENDIKNAWVYERELNIDVKGYTLDPIDLKYYDRFCFEINNGKLELAIKYEDEYEIFIEHIFDELYVTEYDKEGNECCIYCHETDCDCLDEDDKCYCAELSESLKYANEEIEELKAKIIKLQKEKLEMLDVLKKLNEREMKRLGLVE